jgi:hypothetical protein
VPFDFAFAPGDLGERLNAARCDAVDPGARLGYGAENSILGLSFQQGFGLEPMQDSFD